MSYKLSGSLRQGHTGRLRQGYIVMDINEMRDRNVDIYSSVPQIHQTHWLTIYHKSFQSLFASCAPSTHIWMKVQDESVREP